MTANWGGGGWGGSVIRILQRPYRDRVNFIVIRAKSSDSASPPPLLQVGNIDQYLIFSHHDEQLALFFNKITEA